MKTINFSAIERKWQKRWEEKKAFQTKEKKESKKFYVLEMYPYPSGSGLHMGHAFNYTIGDVQARLKRMQGFNVLYPMGYDSFGLPAENAAIDAKSHPKKFTEEAIKNYIKQQKKLGLSYDWSRMIKSHNPDFYKWDQWIFLKMLEQGLAYRKKAVVNFCPKCNTVLANEQVVGGKCWRHEDTDVEVKKLEQWFFKITEYADELLDGLDKLDGWPEHIKKLQRNWIGKSQGVEIDFEVASKNKKGNCVIVHGCPGKKEDPEKITYDKHWLQWIRKELEKKGFSVEVPLMPEPWDAKYSYWKTKFDNMNVNEESILIGTSCGSAFLVRWLGETKKRINKLILVAPWKIADKSKEAKNGFYDFEIDKGIKDRANEIIIFTSDNDYEVGRKSAKIYHDTLGGELIELPGKGHYVIRDMGTEEFPELLEKITSGKTWKVFTTRPDTLFGVSFLVVSAQHSDLDSLITDKQRKEVDKFLKMIKSVSEEDLVKLDKEGVFTGSYAEHPLTGEKIPIWAGNFVVADYGSGIVMAVPAHDQRDFEFAKKYKLPIKEVIKSDDGIKNRAYSGYGILINSQGFDGLKSEEAKEHILNALEMKSKGRKKVAFRLRDWLISRQRFWGCPIPIIYCDDCGAVPVPEKDLPVKLPDNIKFTSKENPLKSYDKFVKVKCPKCGNVKARRETDTMDTFVDSSWYFMRYADPNNEKKIFDSKKANFWLPVDQYIGGTEQATAHLIYFRFFTKFFRDLGLLDKKINEPALRLFNQGMLRGSDGQKMSKSKGNVVSPESVSEKYGIDASRMFLVSVASPDKDLDWSDKGAEGSLRFVLRIMNFVHDFKPMKMTKLQESKLNRTIRDYTSDLENFRYNLAVIKLRELFGVLEQGCDKKSLGAFLKMFSVICPHTAEELWSKIGGKKFISLEKWPEFDKRKIDDKLEEAERNVEKTVEDIINIKKIIGVKNPKTYIYVVPGEIEMFRQKEKHIEESSGSESVKVFAVNDKDKYDPEGKSKKVKPGRPGIFVDNS